VGALVVVTSVTLAACGTVTGTGTAGAGALAANVPASQLKIIGDGNTKFDQLARNALADVEEYWKQVYPTVSGGKQMQPLRGGIYSVTTGHPNTANACMARQANAADNNAFYCPLDDSFAYDRTGLVGQLAQHFGPEMAMVVIAHEFGHLIQNRLNIDRPVHLHGVSGRLRRRRVHGRRVPGGPALCDLAALRREAAGPGSHDHRADPAP
jgi:predicted metalloprotease